MRTKATGYRWLSLVFCLAAFVSLGGAPSQASTSTPQCDTSNLSLGYGDKISPMTGEMGGVYTLTNRGKATCHLYGYPGVSFYDSKGRVLPFKYTMSSSHYMTHAAPRTVTLRPVARAYFLVAKYRCDIGNAMIATTIRVYPPNSRKQLTERASAVAGISGGTISYCKGGTKDPGQVVDISPVKVSPKFL